MLSPQHRLRSSATFGLTVRKGRKKGSRTVVVYLYTPPEPPLITTGGPQVGLVVSKAVGNSVVRHTTARKIRAAMREVLSSPAGVELREEHSIVVRALPNAAAATTQEVEKDVRSCLRRILRSS